MYYTKGKNIYKATLATSFYLHDIHILAFPISQTTESGFRLLFFPSLALKSISNTVKIHAADAKNIAVFMCLLKWDFMEL